jgi:hypothetical protein
MLYMLATTDGGPPTSVVPVSMATFGVPTLGTAYDPFR